MDNADFLIECAKNSIEADCTMLSLELDYDTDTVKLTVRDDGKGPMIDNVFSLGASERGPHRGLGLYMLRKASGGRCALRRENGYTVLEAFLPLDKSLRSIETTLPALFNLKTDTLFIKKEAGKESWRLSSEDLEREKIDPSTAQGLVALRNMVLINEKGAEKNG